jgi:hypothetical protein
MAAGLTERVWTLPGGVALSGAAGAAASGSVSKEWGGGQSPGR